MIDIAYIPLAEPVTIATREAMVLMCRRVVRVWKLRGSAYRVCMCSIYFQYFSHLLHLFIFRYICSREQSRFGLRGRSSHADEEGLFPSLRPSCDLGAHWSDRIVTFGARTVMELGK